MLEGLQVVGCWRRPRSMMAGIGPRERTEENLSKNLIYAAFEPAGCGRARRTAGHGSDGSPRSRVLRRRLAYALRG